MISKIAAASASLLVSVSVANAASHRIWHGWADFTPCSKVVMNDDGLFPVPVAKFGPQELHASVILHYPDELAYAVNNTGDALAYCAWEGIQAATIVSLFTAMSATMPTFTAAFSNCLHRYVDYTAQVSFEINIEPICRYD